MSQLEKHHICCRLKVPQEQGNSKFHCPAIALLSAPCPTRGRSSCSVRVTALSRRSTSPWLRCLGPDTEAHWSRFLHSPEGQQGNQNKELVIFPPQHIKTHWQDRKRPRISPPYFLANVTPVSFQLPYSLPGNQRVTAEAAFNPKQELHFCSHSLYRMTKLEHWIIVHA